jgi:hypothetical protein
VSSGSLPPGLTLAASTGILAGTPTTAGTYSFTLKVTDSASATATQAGSLTITAGSLSISVPATATLPTVVPGGRASGQLGTVTVTDTRGSGPATWTATVSATAFITGGGSAGETIPLTSTSYWSGPATAVTGSGTLTPGQPLSINAVNLSSARAAFSLAAGSSLNSASWNPTLVISVPAAAIGGRYTATITHSVA